MFSLRKSLHYLKHRIGNALWSRTWACAIEHDCTPWVVVRAALEVCLPPADQPSLSLDFDSGESVLRLLLPKSELAYFSAWCKKVGTSPEEALRTLIRNINKDIHAVQEKAL